MNSSITKARKCRRKVVIRCRKLSSTSNKSQMSCSRGSAAYKQRMKVISRNNKELASALQDTRCDLANKEKYLNNMMSAQMKMLEMHTSLKSFMKDFDQVLFLLNTDDTKQPPLKCSLMPRNEFKSKMNNLIESVEETSEPESSYLDLGVATGNTEMIVEEIVSKAVPNSSKNDKNAAVVNHMPAAPLLESSLSEVSKEAVFNEELNIDALSRRKREQFGTPKLHLPSPTYKSPSSFGKSSDLKFSFLSKSTVSPLSDKKTSANSQLPSPAAKSKNSKIPKIHNILKKTKKNSMSCKTNRDEPFLKTIIAENVVKESEDFRRLTFVKKSDIPVPDSTSSNDNLEVPSPMKLSNEGVSIFQGPNETLRRQTFVVKDLKHQCDRRKTFVKKPKDMNDTILSSKDRRGTFTISNKIDENDERFINEGKNDVCDSVTKMYFQTGTSCTHVGSSNIGIIKALYSVDDGVLKNCDATATDSQAIFTEMCAGEHINASVDSIQKESSGSICKVNKNFKQSKKLPGEKCSELDLFKQKADNPEAACAKLMGSEADLFKEKADNPEAAGTKLMGSELHLCKQKGSSEAAHAILMGFESDLSKEKADNPEAACAELMVSEADLCRKKTDNPEAVCAKLMIFEPADLYNKKADNPEAACAKLIGSELNLSKKKVENPEAACAKAMDSEIKYAQMNTDQSIAPTEGTSLKLKSTGNIDKRLPKGKKPRLSKITANFGEKSLEEEIDTEKPSFPQHFKSISHKQFQYSDSDDESVQKIDLDALEVPPLKITPVIRRAPKVKKGKVFVFHGNKRKSILSKSSKNIARLPSDAVCQTNDSKGDVNKENISDASLIVTQNIKKSKKSVSFCFSNQKDELDTLCIEGRELNNSTVQQKAFKLSCVERIAENVIEEYDETNCKNNYSHYCSSISNMKLLQAENIPTKCISSEMECKENIQPKNANDFKNPQNDFNFSDRIGNDICKDIVKPAEVQKIRGKGKTNNVDKKSKRGTYKKKMKGTVQDGVIFSNINACDIDEDEQCKIETKKVKSKVKKKLPVNTFLVEAEIHPPPPPSAQGQNEEVPPILSNLRLSVVLSDIFESEDAKLLNIPSNKDVFLKGRTSFPLKIPLSENSSNVNPAVYDLRKEIPVINLESEMLEDLTGVRSRRARKALSYKEPTLNVKMRRLK